MKKKTENKKIAKTKKEHPLENVDEVFISPAMIESDKPIYHAYNIYYLDKTDVIRLAVFNNKDEKTALNCFKSFELHNAEPIIELASPVSSYRSNFDIMKNKSNKFIKLKDYLKDKSFLSKRIIMSTIRSIGYVKFDEKGKTVFVC